MPGGCRVFGKQHAVKPESGYNRIIHVCGAGMALGVPIKDACRQKLFSGGAEFGGGIRGILCQDGQTAPRHSPG
jgi:hypothetical protein